MRESERASSLWGWWLIQVGRNASAKALRQHCGWHGVGCLGGDGGREAAASCIHEGALLPEGPALGLMICRFGLEIPNNF